MYAGGEEVSIRLRIFDPRRTRVVQISFRNDGVDLRCRWIAFAMNKDWAATFMHALDLLMEEAIPGEQALTFGAAGQITWKKKKFWTAIQLDLGCYSANKRRLLAEALLKSIRNGI